MVDFDAGVEERAAAVAAERAAAVQVRGWGSLWPTSAHNVHLAHLAVDRVTAPPEFAADWSESLIVMPRMLAVPPLWAAGDSDREVAAADGRAVARSQMLGRDRLLGENGGMNGSNTRERVLGFTGETVQLSRDAIEIWRETLEHSVCASVSPVLAVTDYMNAHEEVAAGVGEAAGRGVVAWPAQHRASLASLSDVVVDSPSMSATLGTALTQVFSAVAGGGVPFVTVAGRSTCTRFAAAALVSVEEGSVLGSSLARSRAEVPELACRMLARHSLAFPREARAVVRRLLNTADETGRMWERAARVLLDLAEADEAAGGSSDADHGEKMSQSLTRRRRRDFHVVLGATTRRDFTFIPLRM